MLVKKRKIVVHLATMVINGEMNEKNWTNVLNNYQMMMNFFNIVDKLGQYVGFVFQI